jgi:ABC-type antimicrobial peptide transport system permease subunit
MFEQGDEFNMDEAAPQPAEQSNRTFIIVAGVLAGIVFLSIVCMAIYALVYLPQQKASQSAQQATIEAQNAMIAQAMTSTMQAYAIGAQATSTKEPTAIPTLALASPTPLLAVPTQTQIDEYAAMTATWSALNTQVAVGLLTPTATGGTGAMPSSGFADEVGVPGLVVMALALIVVILLARRLRTLPN